MKVQVYELNKAASIEHRNLFHILPNFPSQFDVIFLNFHFSLFAERLRLQLSVEKASERNKPGGKVAVRMKLINATL